LLKQYADRGETKTFSRLRPLLCRLVSIAKKKQKRGQSGDKNQTLQKAKKKTLKTVFSDPIMFDFIQPPEWRECVRNCTGNSFCSGMMQNSSSSLLLGPDGKQRPIESKM